MAASPAVPRGASELAILPVVSIVQEAAAGRTPLLMTSTWALDYSGLSFGEAGGPVSAAPCLSPGFPLVVSLPVPEPAGGGMAVHVWLWGEEHAQLMERVPAL